MTPSRNSGIGASEVAAVLGLSPYMTPVELWLRKTGRATEAETAQTPEQAWGHYMEPVLAQWYADKMGAAYDNAIDGKTTLPWPGEPLLFATPDRLATLPVAERRLVEIKNVGRWMSSEWGEPGTDVVPEGYLIQSQCYMHVLGVPEAHVVAAIGGMPPDIWVVKYDATLVRMLADAAREWWERHVVADEPPPAVDGAEDNRLATRLAGKANGHALAADADLEILAAQLRDQRALAAEVKDLTERTTAAIKRRMGAAHTVEGAFGKITWRARVDGVRVFKPAFRGEE